MAAELFEGENLRLTPGFKLLVGWKDRPSSYLKLPRFCVEYKVHLP